MLRLISRPSITIHNSLRLLSSTKIADVIKNNHPQNNIPDNIIDKLDRKLHLQSNHPLNIIKTKIENYCNEFAISNNQSKFESIDNLNPIVSTISCFDDLRVKQDHVSRRPSDTYYVTNDTVLRTHTSAHQTQFITQGCTAFLCSGDVYRRDEIDSSHYPIFHQMEGVRMFSDADLLHVLHRCMKHRVSNPALLKDDLTAIQEIFALHETHGDKVMGALTVAHRKVLIKIDLQELLYGLSSHLFGTNIVKRWREDYFPFTIPSFELDIQFLKEGAEVEAKPVPVSLVASSPAEAQALAQSEAEEEKWLEVLGCGIIHDEVIAVSKSRTHETVRIHDYGWAFGLGLERLAMILFHIPDIRLFWSQDARFLSQFKHNTISKFQPYSKYPLCYKDVSFWLPVEGTGAGTVFHPNEVFDIIRNTAGDLVERVYLLDEFTHPKTGKVSHAYRIEYRSMERNLTNEEVDKIQVLVRETLVKTLLVQLR